MRKIMIGCIILAMFAAAGCALVPQGAKRPEGQTPISPEPSAEKVKVVLYFGDKSAEFLWAEERVVTRTTQPDPVLALTELAKGPTRTDRARVIPEGTKVLAVDVVNGVAYANFSKELRDKHWGGSAGELFTVYGIVATLTEFPQIDRVQILVEGQRLDSLAGHMILSEPIARDESILRR